MLVAVVIALFTPRAFAAAPMCDPSGASVVAPVPALPNMTGTLTNPKPCEEPSHQWVDRGPPQHDSPLAASTVDPVKRILAVSLGLPARRGRVLPAAVAEKVLLPTGHAGSIYRPPRS